MAIRPYHSTDRQNIITLIANFRVSLAEFKGIKRTPNLSIAEEELDEYIVNTFPIFVAEVFPPFEVSQAKVDPTIVGYLVCRIQDDVVWAESMYVQPAYRKRGIGTQLYAEAEQIARKRGSDTVYNWVHPNNSRIIHFLQKRGYTVLNLIELRKPREKEKLTEKISIFNHEFDY